MQENIEILRTALEQDMQSLQMIAVLVQAT